MALSFIDDFEKTISKMPGVLLDGGPPRYWLNVGNFVANYVLSGSFYSAIPQGRITGICGPSGAGKSYISGNIIKYSQADGVHCVVIDSEHALDDSFMTKIGVDTKKDYTYIGVNTISRTTKIFSTFIKGYRAKYGNDPDAPRVLILIDSLDMLNTDSEAANYAKGEVAGDQGQHAKQTKKLLKDIMSDIKDINVSVVVTKQTYRGGQDHLLRGEGVWVINDSFRYPCSVIMVVSRLKLKDEETKDVTGIRLKVEGFKTRFTRPFQVVTCEVPYDTGMDPYSGLLEVAIHLGIVDNSSKGWYRIVGEDAKWRRSDFDSYGQKILRLCEEKVNGGMFLSVMSEEYVEDLNEQYDTPLFKSSEE